jgi:hypothetical protein
MEVVVMMVRYFASFAQGKVLFSIFGYNLMSKAILTESV